MDAFFCCFVVLLFLFSLEIILTSIPTYQSNYFIIYSLLGLFCLLSNWVGMYQTRLFAYLTCEQTAVLVTRALFLLLFLPFPSFLPSFPHKMSTDMRSNRRDTKPSQSKNA